MRLRLTFLPAALCAIALAGPAAAVEADPGTDAGYTRAKADKNDKQKNKQKNKGAKAAGRRDRDDLPVGTSGGQMRFRGMDRNGDGVITRAEWRGNDVSFRNHDRNDDGVISGAELRGRGHDDDDLEFGRVRDRRRGDPDEVLFARLDRNSDGVLSRREWNGSRAEFERLDANNNGVLSPYEFGVGR